MGSRLRRLARLAALGAAVLVVFVICTAGFWLLAFGVSDAFCVIGHDRC